MSGKQTAPCGVYAAAGTQCGNVETDLTVTDMTVAAPI